MPEAQIDNPQGAFGYLTTVNTPPSPLHNPVVRRFRNLSTATGIPKGAVVVGGWSTSTAAGVATLSTVDEGCYVTTVVADPKTLGVTITSCAARSTGSTLGAPAPSSEYVNVVTYGPVYGALLTTIATAPVAGDVLVTGSATLSGGSTAGFAFGGTLMAASSAALGASTVQFAIGVLGYCITPGTTGTTGFLTTIGNRGAVWVNPSVTWSRGSTA